MDSEGPATVRRAAQSTVAAVAGFSITRTWRAFKPTFDTEFDRNFGGVLGRLHGLADPAELHSYHRPATGEAAP